MFGNENWMGGSRPPPPSLPHQGGGVRSSVARDPTKTTGQHLPLDGGGWEGVRPHAQNPITPPYSYFVQHLSLITLLP